LIGLQPTSSEYLGRVFVSRSSAQVQVTGAKISICERNWIHICGWSAFD